MNKIIKYLSEFNELELKEDFEEIVREFNKKDRQKNKPVFLEPVLIGNTIIGGGMFEDYKKEFKNRMKATNAEKDEVIRSCREDYVNRFLKDKTLDKIYNNLLAGKKDEEIMPITSDNLTKYGFYSQKHLMQEVIKFKNYLNDIEQKDFNNLTSDNANIIPQLKEKPYPDTVWFRVGIKFATGEMDKFYDNNYTGIKNEYSAPKIAKEIGISNAEKYILATLNNYTKTNVDKNIFANPHKIKTIIGYCKAKNIELCQSFLDKTT